MNSFADYRDRASQYITFIDSTFYPDLLDEAKTVYSSVIEQFLELVRVAESSPDLLQRIAAIPDRLFF